MEERQTILEISKSAFLYNVKQIENYVGKEISLIPVIKANAYGTYINRDLELIKDFKIVAVAIVEEAVALRKIGFENDILVLNQPYIEEIENILKYNVTVGVASKEFIEMLGKAKHEVKVHLEIETGMGRTGIEISNLENWINMLKKFSNIKVEGIYTHLSSPDCDAEYTENQLNLFEKAVKTIKKEIPNVQYIHSSASNGILNFPKGICNSVRPGLILYGYPSSNDTYEKIDLKPVAKLKSKISFLKEVEKGTSISYGRSFISKEKMKVATVGIGYADGLKRELSNKGKVVINGRKVDIIGKVCMDSILVDVTHIENVKIGDEVWIWENEKISLEEIAEKCRTINYEILSTIGERVPRKFVD